MNKAVHTVSTAITRVGEACSHYRPVWQALAFSRSSTELGLRTSVPGEHSRNSTGDVRLRPLQEVPDCREHDTIHNALGKLTRH